jgi:hypothetical protein
MLVQLGWEDLIIKIMRVISKSHTNSKKLKTTKTFFLKFLAFIISIWQAILYERTSPKECFLSPGNNLSAVGWLHKVGVDPDKNLPLFLASRKFTKIMLSSNKCIYSQHIPGASNKSSDALSRRFNLSDKSLSSFISSLCPNQVPVSFRICPVHPMIDCWMTSWLGHGIIG